MNMCICIEIHITFMKYFKIGFYLNLLKYFKISNICHCVYILSDYDIKIRV